jgi:N-acetylmuramoyl-L-alanine amidase
MIRHGTTPVDEVVIHTTATPSSWFKGKTAADMVREVTSWHRKNGWRTIGYHGLIAPDGTRANGRPFTEIGAHVKEKNRGTIGITLVPVNDVDPHHIGRFEDYYTKEQRAALKAWIAEIDKLTPIKRVTGHNDYTNAKTCPGFKVRSEEWMP